MASWSKLKIQMESFLCPELKGRIEYRATSYRYAHDRAGRCYMTVDKKEVFSMCDLKYDIKWYETEQEIIKGESFFIPVTEEEIEAFSKRPEAKQIPRERIPMIIRKRKSSEVARAIVEAQGVLARSDFFKSANTFLTTSVDECLKSNDILLNIFAIVDRRVGKNRLRKMEYEICLKHPIVQYFYKLRLQSK